MINELVADVHFIHRCAILLDVVYRTITYRYNTSKCIIHTVPGMCL